MIRICLIRHGMTPGNLEKRYIGVTDESLCEEGQKILKDRSYPNVEKVFCSPMSRCLETAKIIYPHMDLGVFFELKECDFGAFEGKNWEELSGDPKYQRWIDSKGTMPFPDGESREGFRERCLDGFVKIVRMAYNQGLRDIAIIAHGGTIMNIMEAYAYPEKEYYDWHVGSGDGYILHMSENELFEKDIIGGGNRIYFGTNTWGAEIEDVKNLPAEEKEQQNYELLFQES